jgi:calcium/calmodulin-dependent protein kinase kinase 2
LDLIKEEIAIMKKLNHPNLVSLFEVLDDPEEDSLYMVLEMCKKGVVMKVGLHEDADPYDDEKIRCWFRDMILGIEYRMYTEQPSYRGSLLNSQVHAQGIIHRDLKPDNCLITEDDVLKIVDFGVSEMFDKDTDMNTDKNAGSPAFMPPELCVAKHGHVSGRAADIWSMGITLYCLRYGRIPFHRDGIFELYEAIRNDIPDLGPDENTDFGDLMRRLLEKDPEKRIKMEELRVC